MKLIKGFDLTTTPLKVQSYQWNQAIQSIYSLVYAVSPTRGSPLSLLVDIYLYVYMCDRERYVTGSMDGRGCVCVCVCV